jgi:hypothetical protein
MTGPTSVSAMPLMIPAVLSIVPEKKGGWAGAFKKRSFLSYKNRGIEYDIKLISKDISNTCNVNAQRALLTCDPAYPLLPHPDRSRDFLSAIKNEAVLNLNFLIDEKSNLV